MKCEHCGAELKDDAKFCLNCGAAVVAPEEKICPSCGAKNPEGQHYCIECGWPLDDSREEEVEPSSVFEAYTGEVTKKRGGLSPIIIILVVLIAIVAVGGTVFWAMTRETAPPDNGKDGGDPPNPPVKKESEYQYVVEDVSWDTALQRAKAAGGHLVTIDSQEEFNKIANDLTNLRNNGGNGRNFFIGARRGADSNYYWVDSNGSPTTKAVNSLGSNVWLPGEPSLVDNDTGLDEAYLEMLYKKNDDRWYFNDTLDSPTDYYSELSGKTGYIIEFD